MANCKKVSIDFHGVITENPEFFGKLARLWRQKGIEIHVVSGGPREYIEKYLQTHEFPYDVLWCIFDYFNVREKIKVAADGSFHVDDLLWDAAKGQYCARQKIGLHIDDSKVYGKYFTTPYVRFDSREQKFEFGHQVFYVCKGVELTAETLETLCMNSFNEN